MSAPGRPEIVCRCGRRILAAGAPRAIKQPYPTSALLSIYQRSSDGSAWVGSVVEGEELCWRCAMARRRAA